MMFKNLSVYRLQLPKGITAHYLSTQLAALALQGCNPTEVQSIGWVSPRDGGDLVYSVTSQFLLALGVEQRLLPTSVVKQVANTRAASIESAEGRRVGRKEMREIREQVALELLPRAFIRRRTTFAWIDTINGWLVVDSSTSARAEELIEHLRKSIDGLKVKLFRVNQSPVSAMTGWVSASESPSGFTLDQDLELRSAEHSEIRYVKHSLDGEEILQYIAEGKVATKLAMTWRDRISFVLTDNLQIKRLSFLDIIREEADSQAENEHERFDIDFTLMTYEMSNLLADIVEALGGEMAGVV